MCWDAHQALQALQAVLVGVEDLVPQAEFRELNPRRVPEGVHYTYPASLILLSSRHGVKIVQKIGYSNMRCQIIENPCSYSRRLAYEELKWWLDLRDLIH
jgi:hypothetical protein